MPGVTKVSWLVDIVNDGLKESKDEKFKISLRNASYAILGEAISTVVQLVDFDDGLFILY